MKTKRRMKEFHGVGESFNVTAGFSPTIAAKLPYDDQQIARIVAGGTLGGATSVLAGGKFGDGFVTGAYSTWFNGEQGKWKGKWRVAHTQETKMTRKQPSITNREMEFYRYEAAGPVMFPHNLSPAGIAMWTADMIISQDTYFVYIDRYAMSDVYRYDQIVEALTMDSGTIHRTYYSPVYTHTEPTELLNPGSNPVDVILTTTNPEFFPVSPNGIPDSDICLPGAQC